MGKVVRYTSQIQMRLDGYDVIFHVITELHILTRIMYKFI